MVEAVLADFPSAPISEAEKALFSFLDQMIAASPQLRQQDVDKVLAAGWTQEAVYDALTVCALFSFYNKWVDASGVSDMPAAAYAASGERLATVGYFQPAQSGS